MKTSLLLIAAWIIVVLAVWYISCSDAGGTNEGRSGTQGGGNLDTSFLATDSGAMAG